MAKAEQMGNSERSRGIDFPVEITRREDLLAANAEAKLEIEMLSLASYPLRVVASWAVRKPARY